MPKQSDEKYAADNATVLELAKQASGTTIQEIMDKVGCSRPRATDLTKELNLKVIKTEGRKQFFGTPDATPIAPTPKPEKAGSTNKPPKKEKTQAEILESKARRAASTMVSSILSLLREEMKNSTSEGEVSTDVVQVEGEPNPAPSASETPAAPETPVAEPTAAAS